MSQIPMLRFPTLAELPVDSWQYGLGARAPLGAGALPIICVSVVAVLLSLLLGGVQAVCRRRLPGHANVSWHLLGPAVLFLALSHVGCVVVGLAFFHDPRVADRERMRRYGPMAVGWFNGLHTLFVLAACKTVFWEVTAPAKFRVHDNIRRVSLAFDALLFFLISGSLFATTFEHNLCLDWNTHWRHFCFPNAVDNVLAHLVNPQISRGLQIFVFLEYLNILLSSLAAGSWARAHGSPSPVADVMIFVVSPLLALQMFACIATMGVGLHVDFSSKSLVYYVSLPYWILQVVVLAALMWAFRTRPLRATDEIAAKESTPSDSLTYYSPQPSIAPLRPLALAASRTQLSVAPAQTQPFAAPARPQLSIVTRQSLLRDPPLYQQPRVTPRQPQPRLAPAGSEWSVSV